MMSQDHDLIIRLDEKITEILRRMDNQDQHIGKIELQIDDTQKGLSNRISTLENFRWYTIGIAAGVGGIASYIIRYLYK